MSARRFLLLVAVLGAVGGPYFLASPENREKFTQWVQSFRSDSGDGDDVLSAIYADLQTTSSSALAPHLNVGSDGHPASAAGNSGKKKNGTPAVPLERFLRFDITPAWVIDTWPRVTTRLYDGALEGVRVPVMTGTAVHDLVGSLTYYFDKQLQVQRIVLHGHTGDGRRFVSFVTHYYGLQLEPSLGGWFFTSKWNGKPTSFMHVQHAPVVTEKNRRRRVQVDLELNVPGAPYGVSAELKKLISEKEKQRKKQPRSVVDVAK